MVESAAVIFAESAKTITTTSTLFRNFLAGTIVVANSNYFQGCRVCIAKAQEDIPKEKKAAITDMPHVNQLLESAKSKSLKAVLLKWQNEHPAITIWRPLVTAQKGGTLDATGSSKS